jgi:hypothetical protein
MITACVIFLAAARFVLLGKASFSIRPGTPALMVIDEAAVPSIYWEPREPRLNRQGLVTDLKQGAEIAGVVLSNPEPVLSVRTK